MTTYAVSAINIGTFNLGEADKILTMFTAEQGLIRAVAKGARKPGSKMTGLAEVLNVNHLLITVGKSLDIITQAQSTETFMGLRKSLIHLAYGLYYAELTQVFGSGLAAESQVYFDYLIASLKELTATNEKNLAWLCLKFEMSLLEMLGYKPELTCCVMCRCAINEARLAAFHHNWGGIICRDCMWKKVTVAEAQEDTDYSDKKAATELTPLVWKHLVLASAQADLPSATPQTQAAKQSLLAAKNLIKNHVEYRAGKKMKSFDLVNTANAL